MTKEEEALLKEELTLLLIDRPEAGAFVWAYCDYIHAIDDIIDEKITDPERLLRVFAQGAALFSSRFYREYGDQLYLIEALINNDYADSVAWEKSDVKWKRENADVLRHSGSLMLYAIIFLLKGRDALRSISAKVREHNYIKHHKEGTDEPI